MTYVCEIWGTTEFLWKDADWKWSECRLVAELGGPSPDLAKRPWEEWELPKVRRLVHLISKVKGTEYEQIREVKEAQISISDVKLVIEAVSGIEVNVEIEEK